jgi:hypothetical protein
MRVFHICFCGFTKRISLVYKCQNTTITLISNLLSKSQPWCLQLALIIHNTTVLRTTWNYWVYPVLRSAFRYEASLFNVASYISRFDIKRICSSCKCNAINSTHDLPLALHFLFWQYECTKLNHVSCFHICGKAGTRRAQCLFILQSKPIQPPYSAQHAVPGYRIPHEASMSFDELHAWHFRDVSTLRRGMLFGSLSNTTTATCNISQVNADFYASRWLLLYCKCSITTSTTPWITRCLTACKKNPSSKAI